MTILPVSGLTNYNVKLLTFKGVNNTIAPKSDKNVTTKDIPYFYPVAFNGCGNVSEEVPDMEQRLKDSKWAKGVFERYGMKAEIDEDGLLILDEFRNPDKHHGYEDFDINVKRLVQNVKKITGKGIFLRCKDLCVPNLEDVGDLLSCYESKNIKFPKLKTANNINCVRAESIDLSSLETANEIYCNSSLNINLSALKTVDWIGCAGTEIIDLSSLKDVNSIDFKDVKSIKLPKEIIEKFNVPRDCIAA